jgi:NAD(P)-dependent dehydrogenase (short-subunit alcohol dehydrogenase family)
MPSVLITGAGRGFGRDIFDVYVEREWTVFPLVRDRVVAADLKAVRPEAVFPIVSDVTSDTVGDLITETLREHGSSLDLLINNAGTIKKDRWLANTEPSDLLDYFDVHCVGALRCVQAAWTFLKESRSAIVINISSRFGSIQRALDGPHAQIYSYQIAKAAQNMLTALLHVDARDEHIRVFSLHPGRLKTSVAAPDADTEPRAAAEKLFEWVQKSNLQQPGLFYDLISEEMIEW